MPEHGTRYYLDEDVPVQVAPAMRALGIDVLTTLEAGRLRAADVAQLDFAAEQGRITTTRNIKDFIPLSRRFEREGKAHAGVLLIPASFAQRDYGGIARAVAVFHNGRPEGMTAYQVDFLRSG